MDPEEESEVEKQERVRHEFFLGENGELLERLYREQSTSPMDRLYEAVKSQRKKNYPYGKYWTKEDLEYEFIRGKIFVLSFRRAATVLFLIFLLVVIGYFVFFVVVISIGSLSGDFQMSDLGGLLIPFLALEIPLIIIVIGSLLERRKFLAIGSSGVYYQKLVKRGYFRWHEVVVLMGRTGTRFGPRDTVRKIAKVLLRVSGETISFDSSNYSLKEFGKKVRLEMFLNLFETYRNLSMLVGTMRSGSQSEWKNKLTSGS